ncbi:MAG: hypothetical protein J5871_00195 [Bacteroidales bacterium]|nr:hypothetical protein [Bacteroidales bacterium]
MKKSTRISLLVFAAGLVLYGCATQRKLETIKSEKMEVKLVLPKEKEADFKEISTQKKRKDTLQIVDFEGREMLIMNAIKDENGEMVATEQLQAAVVTARFRNVAERHGKIDLEFQVIVPEAMQDSKWQLRFDPDMFILGDSIRLDPVIITGKDYRKAQLRGYQQYERFLNTIINDTTKFINLAALEIFLQRNIPQVYALKNDTTRVSDEEFASIFGVTEREAIDHYTNHLRKRWNNRRKSKIGMMFRRYVKAPIVTEGIRLDTVIQMNNGDFVYNYIQTINTRPKLRKVDIVLSGGIYEQDKRLYVVPRTEPLTFYISSLAAFVDNTERYLTKVIERKAEANTACYIEFPMGKYEIDDKLGNNEEEISRIKGNLRELLLNDKFDLDSITIAAFASPEGGRKANEALSAKRAESASKYFSKYLKYCQDSIKREEGMFITFEDETETITKKEDKKAPEIRFKSRSGGENWDMLDQLVSIDETINPVFKDAYAKFGDDIKDLDAREARLAKEPYYRYMREKLYPRLRVVKFDFFLHRKGMVKDTIHTTELDTTYMNGVQCLRDRDFEGALLRLRPYNDFNTAIAYVAMDRNTSAMLILKELDRTAPVNYMLAILYAREGDDQNAVQHYLHACAQDPSYVNRGNLDPEISALIRRYGLNKQDDDEFGDLGF